LRLKSHPLLETAPSNARISASTSGSMAKDVAEKTKAISTNKYATTAVTAPRPVSAGRGCSGFIALITPAV